jgi:hypothetical protein
LVGWQFGVSDGRDHEPDGQNIEFNSDLLVGAFQGKLRATL